MLPKHVVNYLTHTLITRNLPCLIFIGAAPLRAREGLAGVFTIRHRVKQKSFSFKLFECVRDAPALSLGASRLWSTQTRN